MRNLWLTFLLVTAPLLPREWMVEQGQVMQCASSENLPIAALFVGAGWCPWSEKLLEEVFNRPTFREMVGARAVLWRIPLKQGPHPLRSRYGVEQCPTLLLLDPQGKEFGRFSGLNFNAELYAASLLELIDEFHEICVVLDEAFFDELKWQGIYEKSKKLSSSSMRKFLLEAGVKRERGSFFHLEKYRELLGKYKLRSKPLLAFKEKMLEIPERELPLKVALLEFEKLRTNKSRRSKKVISPLLKYIKQEGKKREETLWMAEWAIAQFLFERKEMDEGAKFAERALKRESIIQSSARK